MSTNESSTDIRKMAEKLFLAEKGPPMFPHSPYGRQPDFNALWPVDQQRYIKMAKAALESDA